ncbi:DnaJ-like protein subfamily C member 12 [Nibea albiflora]|uniref:DnaJ-like protein subfamily C member 12 n=1 Tax=Nibea albiflora TaxID=240163 RepID=A0ACB7ECT0_NIBAL|nr:DnaJ-like protein subfamily C member 12 [Nibea albiflora]
MEAFLNCKPEDLEDYYGLLGCDELSSTEQILNEYKIRALACHPDKHLDNPRAGTFGHISKNCRKPKKCCAMKPKEKTMTFGKEVELPFHFMTGKA